MSKPALPRPPASLRQRNPFVFALVLWLVLIVLFVFFYNLFSVPPASAVREAQRAAAERGDTLSEEELEALAEVDAEGARPPTDWTRYLPMLVVPVALGFGAFMWKRARRWMHVHNEGVALFTAGRVAEAVPVFEQAVKLAPQRVQRALSTYALAGCQAECGRLQEALGAYAAVNAVPRLEAHAQMLYLALPNAVASCYAQLGDVAQARTWLAEGARRSGGQPPVGALLPEVLVLCREGAFAAAARTAAERHAEAASMSGRNARRVRLLHAFALHAADAHAHAPRVAELLAGVKPVHAGDLEPLTEHWPELSTFVTERGLTPEARTAA